MKQAQVFTFKVEKSFPDVIEETTKQYIENQKNESGGDFLSPPFSLWGLAETAGQSGELMSGIEALAQNIAGFGVSVDWIGEDDEPDSVREYREKIMKLIDDPNEDFITFEKILKNLIIDKEVLGQGYIEGIRNVNGELKKLYHVPAVNMRIRQRGYDAKLRRYFKRGYVQVVEEDEKIFFKDWGDKKFLDRFSGDFYKLKIYFSLQSSDIFMWNIYNIFGDAIGLPKWLPVMYSITSNRMIDKAHYKFFQNGLIGDVAIIVTNGQLSDITRQRLQSFFRNRKGIENGYQAIIITANSADEDVPISGLQKRKTEVDIKPLQNLADMQFENLQKRNDLKIRTVFRLPPLFIGRTEEYTRATASESRKFAEEQVFAPLRNELESILNATIKNRFFLYETEKEQEIQKNVKIRLKGLDTSNITEIIDNETKMLNSGMKTIDEIRANSSFGNLSAFSKWWSQLPLPLVKTLFNQGAGMENIQENVKIFKKDGQGEIEELKTNDLLKTVEYLRSYVMRNIMFGSDEIEIEKVGDYEI